MRIAVDARPLCAPHNGIGRYLTSLLGQLTESPHEWLLYSHRPISLPSHVHAPRVRTGRVSGRSTSTLFAQTVFPRWARQDRADLFWSPRHHLPLTLTEVPGAVTVHDMVWRRAPETMARFAPLLERMLMPPSLRRARAIITPSQATARDIVADYPQLADRVHVVPLASALTRSTAGGDAGRIAGPYMLFVGTLEPRKNLARVLDAFERLVSEGSISHRLVIAGGPGWKSEALRERLRQAPADSRTDYLGEVSDEDLCTLYRHCDFVLAPSLYEGFGLQILEAFSFGKPVISSSISSMPEVVGDAGLLVDPLNEAAIADAIRRLCDDRPLRDDLAERASARAAGYSWQRTAAATLAILECAAGASEPRSRADEHPSD